MIPLPLEQGFLKSPPLGMLDGTASSKKSSHHGGENEDTDEVT
jgi:hypothetical protein